MLPDSVKTTMQRAYSSFLESRGLKPRQGQKLMIAEIARTLSLAEECQLGQAEEETLALPPISVIEAGTGTGKTLAYLIPAIAMARHLDKKLVLATATVALQEQILYKDLPDLRLHGGMDFSFSLAKGRARYLCLSKLDNALRGSDSQQAMLDLHGLALEDPTATDLALYQEMLEALAGQRWKGDRDDWPEVLEDPVWRGVSVDHGQCAGNRCSHFSNCCFFRARENLQKVDCIVANHDLVLADLSLGGGVILPAPEDTIYIFDEAHHLPVKATNHFSHFLRLRASLKWLEQMPALLARLLSDAGMEGTLATAVEKTSLALAPARASMEEHVPVFEQFESQAEEGGGRDLLQYTFKGGLIPDELREVCHQLHAGFGNLAQALERLQEQVRKNMEAEAGEIDRQTAENWFPVVGGMLTRAQAAAGLWQVFGREDLPGSAPCARWISFSGQASEREIGLSCSPVLAADALRGSLWENCFAAVLTSATLTALGNFDFLQMRAGLHQESRFTRIPSPFDHAAAASLMIPKRGFDPGNSQGHTQAIIDILPVILEPTEASLVLFSSRRQMQDVLAGLEPALAQRVLCQDDHGKQQLLALHRERVAAGEGSVIFGLASLAEGVDLPGEHCRHVVIAKIPFAVPNDPVEATLGEWVKSQGQNSFSVISVPEACLRLVQASGRLLRSESDTGCITILDERLHKKVYGRQILDSLPPYRRQLFDPVGLGVAGWRALL